MMARGNDSSFSMHSLTTRRAIRFVDETREMTASDSRNLNRPATAEVSINRSHVLDDGPPELTRRQFRGARHLALQIVGHAFLLNGLGHAALDGVGRFP